MCESQKSRTAIKDQEVEEKSQKRHRPRQRSQTIEINSFVKVDVPGHPSYMKQVVKKLRLKEMSARKFDIWAGRKSRDQSASKMGVVDELPDEADSWKKMSVKNHVSSKPSSQKSVDLDNVHFVQRPSIDNCSQKPHQKDSSIQGQAQNELRQTHSQDFEKGVNGDKDKLLLKDQEVPCADQLARVD